MGLAASQARLLTITSRLSNTELRQQQIANTKMRLSADQEQVSTKYSNALNNQTLTLNDAPMTYSDLVAAGYSVVRTSDGASTQATTRTIERTTKNESLKPSMTVEAKKSTRTSKTYSNKTCFSTNRTCSTYKSSKIRFFKFKSNNNIFATI